MRKVLLVIVLFFSISLTVQAAPCYGTKMPLKGKFFTEAQSYTLFKRYLKDNYGELRSRQHFLGFSYGVYDWFSLDLKIGTGNIKQHPLGRDEADYPSSFAGGYGFRLKLCDKEKIKAVAGFQHISVHPYTIDLGNEKNQSVLDDWQYSLLASYDFNRFTPYIGTKWSRVDYIHWVDEERKRKKSDLTKSIGLICGLNLPLTEKTWLNLEGHFLDEQALAVSLNYNF
ncbi:MAG: hypothetical protein ABIH08_02605 [Candidatus Omnitrophota bacterium]